MPQWRVRDAMTTEVITAPDDASTMRRHRLAESRQAGLPTVGSQDGRSLPAHTFAAGCGSSDG
jgi:hypothetical protein